MRNSEGKPYGKPYKTGSAQKRKREAADKVKERRRSRHRANQTAIVPKEA